MRIIDSDNYAASGIETMTFPGGEPHVKCPKFEEPVLLFLKLRQIKDYLFAACALDALCRNIRIVVPFIPYFPAARQDRVNRADIGKYPLTLDIMINLLDISAHPLVVFDPHSDVISDLTDIQTYDLTDLQIPIKEDVAGIISPDQGAISRTKKFADKFYPNVPVILGYKKRDPHSGHLVYDHLEALPRYGRYIIVDDICDGGMTFNLLVKEFEKDKMAPGSHLELIVSHGIFSKGLGAIDSRIEHITTTDSWCRQDLADPGRLSKRLTVLPLNTLFPLITQSAMHEETDHA